MFGNTSSPFTATGAATSFGQPSSFGNASTNTFGSSQQNFQATTPGFGQSTSNPVFGQTAAFGQTTPSFGVTTTVQPTFGTPTVTPAFGTSSAAAPAFGTPGALAPAFGTPGAAAPAFGTPGAAAPAFGTPGAAATAFGTPGAAAPAFGTLGAATPAFGTPGAAAPAFGTTGALAPAFGTPGAAAPAFGTPGAAAPAFASPAVTAPSFGTPAAAPAFGATSTTASFGASTATPAFGTSTTTSFATPTFGSTGLNQQKTSFGTPNQITSNFQVGSTNLVTQPGFNLGQTGFGLTTSTATTTQASVSFNPPQTTSTVVGFGAPVTTKTPTFSFAAPATTAQPSLTFGTSLTSKPTTTTALPSTGFNFGSGTVTQPVTTSQCLSSGLGLNSLSYNSTSLGGKSMLTITGNTATPLYGTKSSDLNASKTQGQIPPKCQTIHPLVKELIESFKSYIKDQKHLCLEVSRASLKPISKISNDAENVKKNVMKLERDVNKNKMLNTKLKEETVKALADVEIAQKAMDYPGGFPCDNSIVTDYFLHLANKFQAQVVALRIELENTEKSIMCELNPAAFTPQELSTTMQRLYECFVALAGRFQYVHAQISNLKVQHLELRKKKLEDYTDIFSKKNFGLKGTNEAISLSTGPSPFSGFRNYQSINVSSPRPQQTDNTLSSLSATAMAHSFLSNTMNKSSLQNVNLLSSPTSAPGSKRGKR